MRGFNSRGVAVELWSRKNEDRNRHGPGDRFPELFVRHSEQTNNRWRRRLSSVPGTWRGGSKVKTRKGGSIKKKATSNSKRKTKNSRWLKAYHSWALVCVPTSKNSEAAELFNSPDGVISPPYPQRRLFPLSLVLLCSSPGAHVHLPSFLCSMDPLSVPRVSELSFAPAFPS